MKFKKMKVLALALVLSVSAPAHIPFTQTAVAEAAAVKLNTTKKTLAPGKTYTLKVSGTKKKVTWSSNKKTVAKVNSKGKVTALKAGKAVISAKVGSVKRTCTITVKNTKIAAAPFTGKDYVFDKFNVVMPKNWKAASQTANSITVASFYNSATEKGDVDNASSIAILPVYTGQPAVDYDTLELVYSQSLTVDALKAGIEANGATNVKITNFKQEKTYSCKNLKAKCYSISYTLTATSQGITQTANMKTYLVSIDNYLIELDVSTGTKADKSKTDTIAQYMLESMVILP